MMNTMFQAQQQAFATLQDAASKLLPALNPAQRRQAQGMLPGLMPFGPGMGGAACPEPPASGAASPPFGNAPSRRSDKRRPWPKTACYTQFCRSPRNLTIPAIVCTWSHGMRLAAFIRANIEPISVEWERFAATLLPEEEFGASVLRNSIVELLTEIAADMDEDQTPKEQHQKSEAHPDRSNFNQGAVVQHALARIQMGLSIRQFISEFSALRATVIRLWQRDSGEKDSASLSDMIRFNEAIDQVLGEGAVIHTEEVDGSRELFLGILGHDLRNPLAAISGLAELQLRTKTPERHAQFASQILASSRRMSHMIDDLLELTRVRLGSG